MRNYWSAITLFSLCLIFIGFCFYLIWNSMWTFSSTTLVAVALLFMLIIYTLLKEFKKLSYGKKITALIVNTISILLTALILLYFTFKIVVYLLGGTEHLLTSYSPDMNYTLDFYAFDAGATGSFGIRGELDGPLGFKKQFYYEKHAEEATIQWLTDAIVVINGHKLNLKSGEIFGYID